MTIASFFLGVISEKQYADLTRTSVRALLIEAAKSPFSNPLLNWDCSYSDQCSLLSKTAFAQSDPKPATRFRNAAGLGVVVSSKSRGTLGTRRNKGSTPPTHLAPEKHAQTPTTHAHWIHHWTLLIYTRQSLFDENPCCIGRMATVCVSKPTPNLPLMTVCKRVLCWRLTQIIISQ